MQVSANRSESLAGVAAPALPDQLSRPKNYYASPLSLNLKVNTGPVPSELKKSWLTVIKHGEADRLGEWLTDGKTLATLVLLLAVIVSGVSSVYAVHLNRQLFTDLKALQYEQGQAQRRWTQLLLEESALNAPNRVESIASGQLGMVIPETDQIEMVK